MLSIVITVLIGLWADLFVNGKTENFYVAGRSRGVEE